MIHCIFPRRNNNSIWWWWCWRRELLTQGPQTAHLDRVVVVVEEQPVDPTQGGPGGPQGNPAGPGNTSGPAYGGGGGGGGGGAGDVGAPFGSPLQYGTGGFGVQLPSTFRNPAVAYQHQQPTTISKRWWLLDLDLVQVVQILDYSGLLVVEVVVMKWSKSTRWYRWWRYRWSSGKSICRCRKRWK